MPKKQALNLTIRLAGKRENVLLSTLIDVANETLQILREIDKEVSHDPNGSMEWKVAMLCLTVRLQSTSSQLSPPLRLMSVPKS